MLNIEAIRAIEKIGESIRNLFSVDDTLQDLKYSYLLSKIREFYPNITIKVCQIDKKAYTSKKNEQEKDIFYIFINNNLSHMDKVECLIHEFAHILLHGEIIPYDYSMGKGIGTWEHECEADCLTRAILISKPQFMQALVSYSRNDGSVDIINMAQYFNVNENIIIERGKDFLIWN